MSEVDSTALHRDMGRLEGRLTAVERELGSFKQDFARRLEAIDTKLDALTISVREERASVQAGWKTAGMIGHLVRSAVAALIGAAAALGIRIKMGG